jgi:hypothetical protein
MDYPRLRARAEAYRDADLARPERGFEWGLDVVFDGLQARLATPGSGP